jgi:hypothetical protein
MRAAAFAGLCSNIGLILYCCAVGIVALRPRRAYIIRLFPLCAFAIRAFAALQKIRLDSSFHKHIPTPHTTLNMAPRRGGSGSSSGSSVSSCPDPFPSTYEKVNFACDVLFLVVLIGITIAMFVFRKRASVNGKKLLSLPYMGAVLFLLM